MVSRFRKERLALPWRGTPSDVLRAAEAEAQAEAARAMVGADMGPNVNSATSPVHGARNRKGYKIRNLDLFSQVEGLKSTNIAHAHSMVKKLPPVCCSLSHLHPVSKMAASPWGQIWVTDFGAGQGGFVSHSGSRFAPDQTANAL